MIKKVLYAALKRFGSAKVKQRIWDKEFAAGKWNYLDDRSAESFHDRDVVLDVIDRYSEGQDILDLGCGTGRTGLEIANKYRSYLGVDISAIAVNTAKGLIEQDDTRIHKNRYVVADISRFIPDAKFFVILFRESLYYFTFPVIQKILRHYAGFVAQQGVIIVRLHSREKYRRIIEHVEENYRVIERLQQEGGNGMVIVFNVSWSTGE